MLRFLSLFLLAGCAVGHRALEMNATAPIYEVSVHFERAVAVTFGPRPLTLLGTGTSADSVLELGGRLQLMTEDSIVIRPSYLILPDTAVPGRRTVRLQQQGFPTLAIVRPRSGVSIGPYRWPYPRAAIMTPGRLLGSFLAMWAFYYFGPH